jgi:hypothetical protein
MNDVITKIEIKIGGKTISLSLAQLKELKSALDEMFPEPRTVTVPTPYPVPYRPWIGPYWKSNWSAPSGTISLCAKAS